MSGVSCGRAPRSRREFESYRNGARAPARLPDRDRGPRSALCRFLLTFALGEASSALSLVVLTFLGQYAVYRARRYRLTRTIYRGVRFTRPGRPGAIPSVRCCGRGLIALTLGLAYPFAQSRLEHFKMRHTFFGNLPGRFEGSGSTLLLRGLLLWMLAVVPFAIGAVATILAIDWSAVTSAAGADDESGCARGQRAWRGRRVCRIDRAWLLLSIAILYPIFQAVVLRWWVSGLRFGDVAVNSRLHTAQVFKVYARFLWLCGPLYPGGGSPGRCRWFRRGRSPESPIPYASRSSRRFWAWSPMSQSRSAIRPIYQATVKLGLWRCVIESLDVSNLATLEKVAAAGEAASPSAKVLPMRSMWAGYERSGH